MEALENKVPSKAATLIHWLRQWQWWLAGAVLLLIPLGGMVVLVLGWNEPRYMDRSMSHWIAELNGTNFVQRRVAAEALAKIGEPSLEPLRLALHKERSFVYELRDKVRKVAPASIQKHIPPSWPVEVLQFNACVGLAAMGAKAEPAVPDLIPLLTNASPALVNRATYALNQIGTNAYPALLAGMKSSDPKLMAQCQRILSQAGVAVAAPIYKLSIYQIAALEQFLNAPSISVDDTKRMLLMLHPMKADAVTTLQSKLKSGSRLRRARVALLLANLGQSSELITQTMMENLEQLPEGERVGCASGLRNQGVHLQSYTERLGKMADDPSVSVAFQIVLLVEKEFGDTKPKWALVNRIFANANEEECLKVSALLFLNLRNGVEMDRTIASLRSLLNSSNEKLALIALDLIMRNPQTCTSLQADVEHLQASQTENTKLQVQAEQVSKVLKLAGGSPVEIPPK